MPPNVNITTTTNQYLAPAWVDQVLRDNWFFGDVLSKSEKWDGSQMLFPMKYQKGVASVAFNGFGDSVNSPIACGTPDVPLPVSGVSVIFAP